MSRSGKGIQQLDNRITFGDRVVDLLLKLAYKISPKYRRQLADQQIKMWVYNKEDSVSKEYLYKTFNKLSLALGQRDEIRVDEGALKIYEKEDDTKEDNRKKKKSKGRKLESLSDLVLMIAPMAENAAGLYRSEVVNNLEVLTLLNEALKPIKAELKSRHPKDPVIKAQTEPARNSFQAAVEARYYIEYYKILIQSLERNLKEAKEK